MSWALGLSVFAPIPKKEHWPLKFHGFLNGGKVVVYDTCTSTLVLFLICGLLIPITARGFAENVAKMYSAPNLSVGLGLVYRLEPLRVELNFAMPLVGRKGERMARGFGVGVGIEFL